MNTLDAARRAADHLAERTQKPFHVIEGDARPVIRHDFDRSAYVGSEPSFLVISRERLHRLRPDIREGGPELLHSTEKGETA